ncbi:alpha-E domain-containing protein [Novipirellula rosea]|uniref:Alpha-E domain-containing protein n=1 Tax=Novipirellula rosea TaxID=1031540 RepID=A0ABP8N4H1_9BACT
MLSRTADAIYWLSRYIERAENVARFVDVNFTLALDFPDDTVKQWKPLIATTGDEEMFAERYDDMNEQNVIQFLTFDRDNPNSVLSCLWFARENARAVRDTISSELWEQVNRFYYLVKNAAGSTPIDSPHEFYAQIKSASHLCTGISESTMSHTEPWHFARLGRMLERADKTARILDVKYFMLLPHADYVGSPYDALLWSTLLKSASAFEMYRKRYRAIKPNRVVEFLVLDRHFARSMHFCVNNADVSLRAITGSESSTFSNPAEHRLGRLRSEMDYGEIGEIIKDGLHEYLDDFQGKLNEVGAAISETFFALKPVATSSSREAK